MYTLDMVGPPHICTGVNIHDYSGLPKIFILIIIISVGYMSSSNLLFCGHEVIVVSVMKPIVYL